MQRVAGGDAGAFRRLIERHRSRAMRVAFAIVRDAGEAEDVVQEAFARVWTRAAQWRARDGGSFAAWLTRIAVNLAIDLRRRPRPDPLGDRDDIAGADPGSDQLVAARQIGSRIRAAMAALPERQRTAFALCQIEHMRNAEAAQSLGISVGALELLLVRARKAMRRQLADLIEGNG
jgi:RNA polymerase sigma-70 factor, ECF subfamily